jgi:hypothetical protein
VQASSQTVRSVGVGRFDLSAGQGRMGEGREYLPGSPCWSFILPAAGIANLRRLAICCVASQIATSGAALRSFVVKLIYHGPLTIQPTQGDLGRHVDIPINHLTCANITPRHDPTGLLAP